MVDMRSEVKHYNDLYTRYFTGATTDNIKGPIVL